MRRVLTIGFLTALLLSCSSGSSSNGPTLAPVVQTSLGPVQGIARNGAYEYRGMPMHWHLQVICVGRCRSP